MLGILLAAAVMWNPLPWVTGQVAETNDSTYVTVEGIVIPGESPINAALIVDDSLGLRLYFPDSSAPASITKAKIEGYATFYYGNPEIIVTKFESQVRNLDIILNKDTGKKANHFGPKGLWQIWRTEDGKDTLYQLPLKF